MIARSIELKRAKLAACDELDALLKEQRQLTPGEEKRSRELNETVGDLSHQIVDAEAEESEAAKRSFNAGNGVVYNNGLQVVSTRWSAAPNGHTGGEPYETGMLLRSTDSFRTAMETRGLIKQRRYENVSLGEIARALFVPSKDPEVRAALAEGADATGGISVPDITLSRFIDTLRANVVCMKAGAVTVPLTSDKTTIARTITDPVAAWRLEAGTVSESDPTFDGVVFQARSLDVLIKASREVLEDSVNITNAIEAALRGAFALALDKAALIGSGTAPEPRGISNTTNVGAVAGGGALTNYDKLCDGVYEILIDNASFPTAMVMPPRTAVALGKLKTGIASDNTPLTPPPLMANIQQFITTALPINESPGTASRVIIGSFDQLYFGIRADFRLAVARELYAGTGEVGFFANMRADVGLAHPQSFAQVTGILP